MAPRKRRAVLVVSDEARVRSFIAEILAAEADVVATASIEQALTALPAAQGKRFELVIVSLADDLRCARGIELVDRSRRSWPWIPVVAIIGANTSESTVIEAFHCGAGDFLKTPFSAEDLRTAIARVAPRRRAWNSSGHPTSRAAVSDAVAFIEEHYMEPLSLRSLARMTDMSRSHLCRVFHAVVGASVRDYVRDVRLRHARDLLSTASMSVTDIAVEVGFYDLPHFDKAFRRRFGFSPTEFQRRNGLVRAGERQRLPAGRGGASLSDPGPATHLHESRRRGRAEGGAA